jgi:hypothetical protein
MMRFSILTRLITLVLTLLVALALPVLAQASGDDVIRDCAQDGDLDKDYSDEELEDAERNMPSDVDQYSDCRDVIRQAQAGGRGSTDGGGGSGGGSGGGGGGGGSDGGGYRDSVTGNDVTGEGGTPGDEKELGVREQQAQDGVAPETSAATAAGADVGDDDSGLPTAALVAIALLGLAAVAGGVYLLRDYLPSGLTSRLPGGASR